MRAWSSIHIANRAILSMIIFGFIAYVHVAIFFDIGIIPATRKPICYPLAPPGTYRIFLSFFNLFYFGLLPSCCMFLFGLFTFDNIERAKRLLIMPLTNTRTIAIQKNRKTNRQLLRMVFFQVLVYCVTGVAFSVGMIITSINPSTQKDLLQLAQDNLINAFVGMLSNAGPNFSFYIFTLSSRLFRRELKKLRNICNHNNNRIQPTRVQIL